MSNTRLKMNRFIPILLVLICWHLNAYAQPTLETPFSQKKMKKDLTVFRNIREAANSGIYKYRTAAEIDSIYQWAERKIRESRTYRDFYNIICRITDFEGSLHNETQLPKKITKAMKAESTGYFPYPVKLIEGKVRINLDSAEIPLGATVISINGIEMKDILPNLYRYYATDGFNITGKASGINRNFSRYYRLYYGRQDSFSVTFIPPGTEHKVVKKVAGIGYSDYYMHFNKRHSAEYDKRSYASLKELISGEDAYHFEIKDRLTAQLTINSFLIGWHARDPKHIQYTHYLDSIFTVLQTRQVKNLIIDVRHNGGGSDPNDMVTYAYLTSREFSENKEAWIAFNKIPYWKYVKGEVFFLMKPIEKILSDRELKEEFPVEKDGGFYQEITHPDQALRTPKANAYLGRVFLLIGPRTASAGSLFAAMVAGNDNTIVVGEETQGGYHGHNGHIPMRYQLPKSKMKTMFSIVNLTQDVPAKENQPFGSGVMPQYEVSQSYDDFMQNRDTVLDYVLNMINTPPGL